jgi:hypothetical protein
MMSIPFFCVAAALATAWSGRRLTSMALWGAAVAALVLLYRLHATDVLGLGM